MINEYFTTDNIAIYAAIVATFALFMSYLQYRFSVKDKKVLLAISYKKHPNFEQNITNIGAYKDGEVIGGNGEAYVVTICNIGNVDAFISEIYVITENGTRYDALVLQNKNSLIMTRISQNEIEKIPAKSQKDCSIYFNKESLISDLKQCVVIDGTGKKWEGKYKEN